MAEQTKNTNINEVWASAGDTGTDPGSGKRTLGFIQEKPTFQLMNHVLELIQSYAKHTNEQGIADWDAVTNYALGGLTKGSDNRVYRSLFADNIGVDPVGENTDWEIAFVDARNHQGGVGVGGAVSDWLNGMDVVQINDAGSVVVDDSGAMYLLVNAYMDQLTQWRSFWTNPKPMMLRMKDGKMELFSALTSGTNASILWDRVIVISDSEFVVNGKDIIARSSLIKTGYSLAPGDVVDVKSIDFAGDGLGFIYLSGNTLYNVALGFEYSIGSALGESTVGTFDISPAHKKARWSTNGNSILALSASIDSIFIYPVAVPWDVSTADLTFASSSTMPLTAGLDYAGIAQTSDGTVIYVLSRSTSGTSTFTITSYTLQAPYDYQNVAFTSSYTKPTTESTISYCYDLSVSADGKKLYVMATKPSTGDTPFFIMTISLSIQGDMSSAKIENESFIDMSISGIIYPYGTSISSSGDRLAVIGRSSYGIKEFAMVRGTDGV